MAQAVQAAIAQPERMSACIPGHWPSTLTASVIAEGQEVVGIRYDGTEVAGSPVSIDPRSSCLSDQCLSSEEPVALSALGSGENDEGPWMRKW